jgi:hypothetical protein
VPTHLPHPSKSERATSGLPFFSLTLPCAAQLAHTRNLWLFHGT